VYGVSLDKHALASSFSEKYRKEVLFFLPLRVFTPAFIKIHLVFSRSRKVTHIQLILKMVMVGKNCSARECADIF